MTSQTMSNTLVHSPHAPESNSKAKAYWGGVFAMTLCAFALVASEFMPVSLLTPISAAFKVSEGLAGQAISISGAFAVLTSLVISMFARRIVHKTFLLWMTAVMFLSGLIIALAPNYTIYMIGRIFIGIAIGGFWSMSAATAIRLVPTEQVPRALAIFNGGNALATVVAAPLGSYLGSVIGWRAAFFCLAPVALLAFIWQWFSLPSMKAQTKSNGSDNPLTLLKNPLVALGLAGASLFFMGQFTLFTYLRPFLEQVTLVDASTLSLILLLMGVTGFLGTVVIGMFLKRGFYLTLITIPLVMVAAEVTMLILGNEVAAVATLLGVWGLVATAAPVGWWAWIAKTLPHNAEAAGGLMVALVQLAIGLGATVGGLLYDTNGYQSTFMASVLFLLFAAVMTFLTSRRSHSTTT